MNILGLLVMLFIVAPLSAVWSGFALSTMWGWLIMPTFKMLPALSVPAAIGLSLVVGYLTHQIKKDDTAEEWSFIIAKMVAVPAVFMLFGFIIKQFM